VKLNLIDYNIKKIKKECREICRRAGNSRKGNPNPKIHLNMNIKNERKTGARTRMGKMISSRNAVKYKGRALRLSGNSLFMQEFERYMEANNDPFLQEIRYISLWNYANEKMKEKFNNP